MIRRFILKIFLLVLALAPLAAVAVVDYKLVTPIPGGGESVSGIEQYARFLFPFLLLFAAASALVMFTVGSVYYIYSASNPSKLEQAKKIMTDAILGLLLALTSVLILQTINPSLTSLSILVPSAKNRGSVSACNPSPDNPSANPPCPAGQRCVSSGGNAQFHCEKFTPASECDSPNACSNGCSDAQKKDCEDDGKTCFIVTVGGRQRPFCQ